MRHSFASLVSCSLLLLGCAASQTPAQVPVQSFDDAQVQHECKCSGKRVLGASDPLAERTVESQRRALARHWRGELHWHAQRFFDITQLAATTLAVELTPNEAYEITCSGDADACLHGQFLSSSFALRTGDRLLDATGSLDFRFLGEAIASTQLMGVTGLDAHRSASERPALMLVLSFAEQPRAELYVLAPDQPGGTGVSQHVIADCDLQPDPTS